MKNIKNLVMVCIFLMLICGISLLAVTATNIILASWQGILFGLFDLVVLSILLVNISDKLSDIVMEVYIWKL